MKADNRKKWIYRTVLIDPEYHHSRRMWKLSFGTGWTALSRTKSGVRAYIDKRLGGMK